MFLAQDIFHAALVREQKRLCRFEADFALVRIDIRPLYHEKNSSHLVAKLRRTHIQKKAIGAVVKATRDIDIKGWYKKSEIIGVLFTEIVSCHEKVLVSKVKNSLSDSFGENKATAVTMSWNFFSGNEKTRNSQFDIDYNKESAG